MGNICAFPHILGSHSSYMTLKLLHSEFPYIWGKLDILFISVDYVFLKKQGTENVWSGPLTNRAPQWREYIVRRKQRRISDVNTVGKFVAGVVYTGGAPWSANISAIFWKNLKWPVCFFQGLEGRWFIKKTRSKISRNTNANVTQKP